MAESGLKTDERLTGPVLLSLTLVIVSLFGCNRETQQRPLPPEQEPILVMGVDGLEWRILLPMIKAGRLPHFSTIMERGTYGYLGTLRPTASPVVWTSVATGKFPPKHGILQFVRRLPDDTPTLFNNLDRKTKAIWSIVSDHGRTVTTIGWWMTYPVEAINGIRVAQTNTLDQIETRGSKKVWKGTLVKGKPGQVYPADRQNEMLEILEQMDSQLPELAIRIFGEFRYPLSKFGQQLWNTCQWSFRADATYMRIALNLAAEGPPSDLTMIYMGGPDVVSHRFWRFMQPEIYRDRPTEEEVANFGGVIEDYYAYTDQSLGQLLEAYGPDLTVVIISDHGMHPTNLNSRFDIDTPTSAYLSGNHQDGPPGVFIAAGPGIGRISPDQTPADVTEEDLQGMGNVLDITPTLLAMLRIPVAKDMDGEVLTHLFEKSLRIEDQPSPVATHDTREFLVGRGSILPDDPGAEERLEQLRSLGYIR